jgi:hypothetical protein
MHGRDAAALLLGAFACTQPSRPAGELRTIADLVDAARAGDPDGTAAVALRGQPLTFLSTPYGFGTQAQEAGRDGLSVQPAFADARPAAFVTTEIWDGFPRVWAQPLYILVTGFDPQLGPQRLLGALPIFGMGTGSRFYSPFRQTFYVTVPAGFAADSLRSGEEVIASGLPLTPGPLQLAPLGVREVEVAHPAGADPVHPFTGDVLRPRLAAQAWADAELTWFLDFGADRFRVNDANLVVQEVALFRFARFGANGTARPIDVPAVVGNGPFRTPRAADAPGGFPRFGALRHEFLAEITPSAGQPTPGVFVSASRPALRQKLMGELGQAFVPQPSPAAERLPQREQYTLRVALDGSCFGLTDFPSSCSWLDTQAAIEGNLPVTAFTDTKRFSAGAFVFFDGVAP